MVEAQATDGTDTDSKATAPPYISFLTFLRLLQWLEQEGVPLRFDRTFWSKKYSGSTGSQLLTGLRFLRLLDGERPTQELERLVEARGDDRKAMLVEILRSAYSAVQFDQLARATPGMLGEWLGTYPGEGDTKRKVESFLLNALKYADFSLSPSLKKRARNRPPRGTAGGSATSTPSSERQERPATSTGTGRKQPAPPIAPPPASATNTRIINLASGGELSLTLSANLLTLSEDDHDFVRRLLKEIQQYADQHSK